MASAPTADGRASIRAHDTVARIGSLDVPTLVLAGEEDILIRVSLSRELHALIPGAAWATTKGGHARLWESPEPSWTFIAGV